MGFINEVEYVASFPRESKCPKGKMPEFAFIGRSNVGKSSLINMITGRKDLARVSKQPGKTSMINYFIVDDRWHLVDLPGYGYAKSSKKTRESWHKMITTYLKHRQQLFCAFVLLDARHELQAIDKDFIDWLGEAGVPFVIIYTKIDKVKKKDREEHIKRIESALLEEWTELPPSFVTSSEDRIGQEELLEFINQSISGIES